MKLTTKAVLFAILFACISAANAQKCEEPTEATVAGDKSDTATSMKAWRKAAADRQRRIIVNNDGNEAVHQMTRPSAEDFLKCRTEGLQGSHVDSLFYCTSSGFGNFKHVTKVGTLFTVKLEPHLDNQLQAMADKGLDCLRIMSDFGKQHGMEVFCSMRMNDNHDSYRVDRNDEYNRYEKARFNCNIFKTEHPEFLMGSPKKRPKIGGWSVVDYGRPEVRDFAFRCLEEMCRNYDLDGVELDFFRHPVYFRSTTRGEVATAAECEQMTDLMRRIRTMADEVGKKRGRPILIAVRVPDSAEYSRAIGLDFERWMADDLFDLLMVAGYFQLKDWDYSVALGHKYDVKVYPSLDESRNFDKDAAKMRSTMLAYRGRAANVWASGADGVYLFNSNDPKAAMWRELGDPAILAKLDKDYFASIRGIFGASRGNLPYDKYLTYETLTPTHPKEVTAEKSATARIHFGEDFTQTKPASLKLRLRFVKAPQADSLQVTINGKPLKLTAADGEWLEATPQATELRKGANVVEVSLVGDGKNVKWSDLMLQVRH